MKDRPTIIDSALLRAKSEGVDSAVSWIWFFGSDPTERDAVDKWLVTTQHPLAMQPGTPTDRFRAIVKELGD